MNKLLIGFLALVSISGFAQVRTITVNNYNNATESTLITCESSNCDSIFVDFSDGRRLSIDLETANMMAEKTLKMKEPEFVPGGATAMGMKAVKRDINIGDYGNAVGNGALTLVSPAVDVISLPLTLTNLIFGGRYHRNAKRASKTLIRILSSNEEEVTMKYHQFSKFSYGLERLSKIDSGKIDYGL